jgi:Predicted nucleoside-diphosphate-sugar epimerases
MILVLGATGSTGGEVARQLIAAGVTPRLFVRNRSKAVEFEGKADIREGDITKESTLRSALAGIEKLYLVANGVEGRDLEKRAIDAAAEAGVRHVVKLSAITADSPATTFAKWHAEIEMHLMDSEMEWTMLRPGSFMTNAFIFWVNTIKSECVMYQSTGDGKWPSIAAEDIAAVAVKALTEPGHEGRGYTFTGSESMNGMEYADVFSNVLGKPVKFIDVAPEAYKEQMIQSAMPMEYVDAVMNLMFILRAGFADRVTNTFEQLMGRKPMSFSDWVRKYQAAFE